MRNSVTICYLSPGARACGIEILFIRQVSSQCITSEENVAPGFHPGGGGVSPTVALQRDSDLRFS
jgi:hypothetical protein